MRLFEWYIQEDGYVESLTAIFLCFTGIIAFNKARSCSSKRKITFYIFIALLFFFGAGEEISWGQRFLGFDTPDNLQTINSQNDFTLHNIQISDIKINKIIFGTGLYMGAFIYFLLFPLLNRKNKNFNRLVNRLKIPVPVKIVSFIYFSGFFGLHLIVHDKVWELQELILTSSIFMVFLYDQFLNSVKNIKAP